MKIVKFLVKFVLWTVAIVLGLAILLVATLPLWIGPVAKPVANSAVPAITQTEFRLGHLQLNPYAGRLEAGDVYLANPPGYSERAAAKLGKLVVDLDPASLATDVIHIREISVSDLFVSVVYREKVLNFKQIQINAAGGEEAYARKQSEAAAQPPAAPETQAGDETAGSKEELAKKKVVIDRLELSGLKVSFGISAIPVPTIILKDLGKNSGGLTWQELWAQIFEQVLKVSGAVGGLLGSGGDALLKIGNDSIDVGTKGLGTAVEQVRQLDLKGAEKTLKDVGKSFKGLFGK